MHVAGNEVMGDLCIIDHIEVVAIASLLGGIVISKYTCCLIAIEQGYGVAYGSEDIVSAVDRRGVVAIGQTGHLVLIVSYRCANLHIPVLCHYGLEGHHGLIARVLQLTAITPIAIDTADGAGEALQGQQIISVVDKVVNIQTEAVIEEIALKSEVHLLRILPLYLVITDVGQLSTDSTGIKAHGSVTGTGSIVADTVVSTHVKSGIQTQIVDTIVFGEP